MIRRRVYVGDDETPSVDDVMQLVAKLPYRDLLEFAGLIQADAYHIASALDAIDEAEVEDAEPEASS